jgi:hypothetical protein
MCEVTSRRGDPINNRPAAHNYLYEVDEFFDYRFSARTKCENYLRSDFEGTVDGLVLSLTDLIADDFRRARLEFAEASQDPKAQAQRRLPVSFVTTSLSDYDRGFAVDRVIARLEETLLIPVADCNCLYGKSAHDYLVRIAQSYREKIIRKASAYRYRGAKANDISKILGEQSSVSEDAPLLMLGHDAKSCADVDVGCRATVVVLLRHVEQMPCEVFSELLEAVHFMQPGLNVFFVPFCSAHCPLPLLVGPSIHPILSVSIRATCTPFDLYDEFIGKVFCGGKLPVSFPLPVVNWLHEKFWRCGNCVQSTLDRCGQVEIQHWSHSHARREF